MIPIMRLRPERVLRRSAAIAAIGILFAFTACHAPTVDQTPTRAALPPDDFDFIWAESLRALRRLGLEPDRQDRVNRVIVTRPETSAQWFEFWRCDVADPYSLAESSLHTVRRQATVRFTPELTSEPVHVVVQVDVYRASTPERQITTASGGLNLFSAKAPTAEGEVLSSPSEAMEWTPLGRDPAMERRIADALQRTIGTPDSGA